MVQFSGPAFAKLDNRLMALQLVQNGLTNAALFTCDGQVMQPADALYKKCILVERGSFRPITKVTLDMLRCAQGVFVQEPNVQGEEVMTLMEMTLKNLTDGNKIDPQDFLDRVDTLGTLGKTVLVSDFAEYHRLAAYFFRYTKKMIGIVMGVAPNLRHLLAHLVENRLIESLRDYDESVLSIFSRDVLQRLRTGDKTWESMVPPEVAKMIRERNLFGCKGVC
jgi:hypothetical protein